MADYRRQIEKLEKFYVSHTKIPQEEIKVKLNADWYIRGEELIDKGIIDEWVDDIDMLL